MYLNCKHTFSEECFFHLEERFNTHLAKKFNRISKTSVHNKNILPLQPLQHVFHIEVNVMLDNTCIIIFYISMVGAKAHMMYTVVDTIIIGFTRGLFLWRL